MIAEWLARLMIHGGDLIVGGSLVLLTQRIRYARREAARRRAREQRAMASGRQHGVLPVRPPTRPRRDVATAVRPGRHRRPGE